MIMNYCFQESFSRIQPKLTKSYSSSRASGPDHPNNHSSARKDKINLLIPDQERPLGPRTRLHNPTKSLRGCIVQGSKDPTQELIKQRQGSARSSSLQLLKSEHLPHLPGAAKHSTTWHQATQGGSRRGGAGRATTNAVRRAPRLAAEAGLRARIAVCLELEGWRSGVFAGWRPRVYMAGAERRERRCGAGVSEAGRQLYGLFIHSIIS